MRICEGGKLGRIYSVKEGVHARWLVVLALE